MTVQDRKCLLGFFFCQHSWTTKEYSHSVFRVYPNDGFQSYHSLIKYIRLVRWLVTSSKLYSGIFLLLFHHVEHLHTCLHVCKCLTSPEQTENWLGHRKLPEHVWLKVHVWKGPTVCSSSACYCRVSCMTLMHGYVVVLSLPSSPRHDGSLRHTLHAGPPWGLVECGPNATSPCRGAPPASSPSPARYAWVPWHASSG